MNRKIALFTALVMILVGCFANISFAVGEKVTFQSQINVDTKEICIVGRILNPLANQQVSVVVTSPTGNIDYIDQKSTSSEGNFEFKYTTSSGLGKYLIYVGGTGIASAYSQELIYDDNINISVTAEGAKVNNSTGEVIISGKVIEGGNEVDGFTYSYFLDNNSIAGEYTVEISGSSLTESKIIKFVFEPTLNPTPTPMPTPTPTQPPVDYPTEPVVDQITESFTKLLSNPNMNGEKLLQEIQKLMQKYCNIETQVKDNIDSIKVSLDREDIQKGIEAISKASKVLNDNKLEAIDKKLDRSLLIDLSKNTKDIALDLEVNTIKDLQSAKINLNVKSSDMNVIIPYNSINLNNNQDRININITKLKTNEYLDVKRLAEENNVSDNSFTVKSSAFKVTANVDLESSIVINLPINNTVNKAKAGIYKFDRESKEWEYVGGKILDSSIEFSAKANETYSIIEYDRSFEDIKDHWAKNEIEEMASRHITKGVDNLHFSPDLQINKAEFLALLVRGLRIDVPKYDNSVSDVSNDKWYANIMLAAIKSKIVEPIDGKIDPEKAITREEMAEMLIKAYLILGDKDSLIKGDLSKFLDKNDVDASKLIYLQQANGLGLLKGVSSTEIAPKQNVDRAQTIVVIKRLLDKLN